MGRGAHMAASGHSKGRPGSGQRFWLAPVAAFLAVLLGLALSLVGLVIQGHRGWNGARG